MKIPFVNWICLFAFIGLLTSASTEALMAQQRDTAMFVEDFLDEQSNWPTMTDKEMVVEGRVSFVAKETIKFLKIEGLEFYIPRDMVPPQKSGRLEVTGELRRQNGSINFYVRRMRGLPSEMDSIDVRWRSPDLNVQDYYDLAKWADKRATFYEDESLANRANEIRLEGLRFARKSIPANDGFALLDVASVAAQQGLPSETINPIYHEAFRTAFSNRDKKTFELTPFLNTLTQKLPGALTSTSSNNLLLANQYRQRPQETYVDAPAASRRFLERVFYQQVVEAALKDQPREDGANGKELSEKVSSLLPESPELATPFLEKYLDYRFQALKTANRQQALELSETYKKQGDDKTAAEVLITWLDYRKGRLNYESVADSVSLADDYLTLAKNTAKASEILDATNRKHPNVEEVELRLARLGYVEVDGKWLTPGQYAALPKDPIMEAMKQGVVSKGMSPEQVYKTLGTPSSTTRAHSASGVSEAWTYDGAGLTIRFVTGQGKSPTVDSITTRK